MQPYFMPYIGYFQLINAVDKFVFYDNVNFIKRGWINRNRLLVHGKESLFTIPVSKVSQNKLINEIEIFNESNNKRQILKTLKHNYKKAPYFNEVFTLFEEILNFNESNLFNYIFYSIKKVCDFLEINTELLLSSNINIDHSLKANIKIIEICNELKAHKYINPEGGTELYIKEDFLEQGIELLFLKPKLSPYTQSNKHNFVPGLSIIDVMMFNSKAELKEMLNDYTFI